MPLNQVFGYSCTLHLSSGLEINLLVIHISESYLFLSRKLEHVYPGVWHVVLVTSTLWESGQTARPSTHSYWWLQCQRTNHTSLGGHLQTFTLPCSVVSLFYYDLGLALHGDCLVLGSHKPPTPTHISRSSFINTKHSPLKKFTLTFYFNIVCVTWYLCKWYCTCSSIA